MPGKTLALNERIYDYLLSVSLREPEVLRRLREESARDSMARMQGPSPEATPMRATRQAVSSCLMKTFDLRW
jgi:predicted O-methyltransferase YrrM